MRILFICGTLEDGCDGVGDYTRRLASACISQGHQAFAVACNDKYVDASKAIEEIQSADLAAVPTVRLSNSQPWPKKFAQIREHCDRISPDYISLQYVPFAYHSKGLPFQFIRNLRLLRGPWKWQIMFHEIWLGASTGSSVKHSLWGALQKAQIRRLVWALSPKVCHTQALPYLSLLNKIGIPAKQLPLFGNIQIKDSDCHPCESSYPNNNLHLLTFGRLHPKWSPDALLQRLLSIKNHPAKQISLTLAGRTGQPEAYFVELRKRFPQINIDVTGECSGEKLGDLLHRSDLGVATSPWALIEKSGSVAAMLEHGLPVVVPRDDWTVNSSDIRTPAETERLFRLESFNAEKLPQRISTNSLLPEVREIFLSDLTR